MGWVSRRLVSDEEDRGWMDWVLLGSRNSTTNSTLNCVKDWRNSSKKERWQDSAFCSCSWRYVNRALESGSLSKLRPLVSSEFDIRVEERAITLISKGVKGLDLKLTYSWHVIYRFSWFNFVREHKRGEHKRGGKKCYYKITLKAKPPPPPPPPPNASIPLDETNILSYESFKIEFEVHIFNLPLTFYIFTIDIFSNPIVTLITFDS